MALNIQIFVFPEEPMKAFRAILTLSVISLMFAITPSASAVVFSYTSGIQVQNLEATTAAVQLIFYNQDGSTATTVSRDIPGQESYTFFPLAVSSGFDGSVVASSNTQIAAVSNLVSSDFKAGGSYIAANAGGTPILLPLLKKAHYGFSSWFNIQNTGTSDATINIAYSDGTNNSGTIKPGAAKRFDQSLETHNNTLFAAVVSSNQPIAATVVEESTKIIYASSGISQGATNPVIPLINMNNNGIITGVQIQNTGDSSTDVTVSYSPSTSGTACTETQTIPSKQAKTFTLAAFTNGANSTCVAGQRFIGSARVTTNSSSQLLTAVVNQLLPNIYGGAYAGFNPASATSKVVMPLIMDRRGVSQRLWTGFNVMNVGGVSTTVNCTFTGSAYTASKTLAPGEALNDLQMNKLALNYVGSASCTASGGGLIVGVVNEAASIGGNTFDSMLVYEAINVTP